MPPLPTAARWRSERVKIPVEVAGKRSTLVVDAEQRGPICVVACLKHRGMWAVTFTASGGRFCSTRIKADAKRIAEEMLKSPEVRRSATEVDHRRAAQMLPSWVKPWALACRRNHAWVPPTRVVG